MLLEQSSRTDLVVMTELPVAREHFQIPRQLFTEVDVFDEVDSRDHIKCADGRIWHDTDRIGLHL